MSGASAARNRLAGESSPYLLLHAGNPVDWYPWGEDAFAKARAEDKPIFLSVGYSTCYWCHVMERESFSDPEIARRLNEGFVSIKLDREERPDLDEIYMTATQLLTRAGGWPNSLFLTHELRPFFAGTYFPPEDRMGRPGFPRVLAAIQDAWRQRREDVLAQAESIAEAIEEQLSATARGTPAPASIEAARSALVQRFDARHGGFGSAPKFPSPSNLYFLLDLAQDGDTEAGAMLERTLDGMARGGIQDQIGGGFHRYSVDAEWLVPHFEKMLYDNAALAALYAEAHALFPQAGFARVAQRTLDFVLDELLAPEAGFWSAIDAETAGQEGAYYVWTRDELRSAVDAGADALLAAVFGYDGRPNFESHHYVLHLPRPLAEQARQRGMSEAELLDAIEPGRRALLAVRAQRQRPLTDDKLLADWNGLMIGALASAGRVLAMPRYVAAATRTAEFVLEKMLTGEGLRHTYRTGAARISGLLDDYAFLIEGLLALHLATEEPRWLEAAARIQAEQDRRLADDGGYFASGDDPRLLCRAKPAYDGAVASGNGVSALNLLELARRTGEASHRQRAERLLETFAAAVNEHPLAHVSLVRALRRTTGGAATATSVTAEAVEVVGARARLEPGPAGSWRTFVLELEIQSGWHLHANPARGPFVATAVSEGRGGLRAIEYPAGTLLRPAGADEPLPVFSGRVEVRGEIAAGAAPSLRLTYQACDDTRCLAPVTREIPFG